MENEWNLASVETSVETASSASIPLVDESIDLVVSSPPYCTRIDYGIATSAELAVLGFDFTTRLRELRGCLIGTPTIQANRPSPDASWGDTCNAFLDTVAQHQSKAAKSYYYKTYVQYFAGITRSISEISRCLKVGGICVLVVQDSYFKDVKINLAQIFAELAAQRQLTMARRVDFPLSRNLGNINTRSRQYRSDSSVTESVLCFARS